MLIPAGKQVLDDCPSISNDGYTPENLEPVDWVIFTDKPAQLIKGEKAEFTIDHNLVSYKEGILSMNILNVNTQEFYGGIDVVAKKGENTSQISFVVPQNATNPVYVIVYLHRKGEDWHARIPQDRIYTLEVE